MSIVNTFFFEELSRIAGHEVGSQWLRQTMGNSHKKRKSSSASFTSLEKLADASRNVSPSNVSRASDDINTSSSTLASGESAEVVFTKTPKIHLDLLPNLHTQSNWPAEMFLPTESVPKLHSIGNGDEDTMGLIYTDAAHIVLD